MVIIQIGWPLSPSVIIFAAAVEIIAAAAGINIAIIVVINFRMIIIINADGDNYY